MADDLMRFRERASSLRDQYRAELDKVRSNRDLSTEGRQRRVATLYVNARAELREYAEQDQALLAERRQQLEKQLFGNDRGLYSDPISSRDAATRAAQLRTADEAKALLEQAEMTDDRDLARAIAHRCAQNSYTGKREIDEQWEGVVRTFLAPRQHLMPIVDELADVETLQAPQVFSPFALGKPHGIPESVINGALSGKEPPLPARKSTGPLLDPAKNTTTWEQREDWAAAIGDTA